MPGGDRTGPMGMGPMTGRGAVFCAGYSVPGFVNDLPIRGRMGIGRGLNCGFGMGRRRRWAFQGASLITQPNLNSGIDELSALKSQAEFLGKTLQSINGRISRLQEEKK